MQPGQVALVKSPSLPKNEVTSSASENNNNNYYLVQCLLVGIIFYPSQEYIDSITMTLLDTKNTSQISISRTFQGISVS